MDLFISLEREAVFLRPWPFLIEESSFIAIAIVYICLVLRIRRC